MASRQGTGDGGDGQSPPHKKTKSNSGSKGGYIRKGKDKNKKRAAAAAAATLKRKATKEADGEAKLTQRKADYLTRYYSYYV